MQSFLKRVGEPLAVVGPGIALIAGPVTGWGDNEPLADVMLITALVVIGVAMVLLVIANACEPNGDMLDVTKGGA